MSDLEIKDACIDATLRFFRALDTREHAIAAGLMTPDGVWERQGALVTGRAAITAVLDARPAERATAHVISNARAEVHGADRATVHFYLTAYEGKRVGTEAPVAQLGLIRSGIDRFVLLAEGWRIDHKSTAPIMSGA